MAALRYFVDEAGDTTLFSRHGKSLDASAGVPSMLPGAGKTARFFHAKDDCAEARHAVFKLLLGHELRLWGVVKEKRHLLHAIRERQAADPVYRYKANGHALYDELIDRLFDHHAAPIDERHVTFAVRGNKARTAALKTVLDDVDARFEENRGYRPHGHTTVHSAYPSASAGLQACDYLLWALQRFYETGKDRHLLAMWPKFANILDLDAPVPDGDGALALGGVTFNEKHPLTLISRTGVGNKDREI